METNTTKTTAAISKRAQRALEVLRAGGYFRKQLERAYQGGEQFKTRLRDASGNTIAGFGFQTQYELEQAGMLVRRDCASSSVWPEEWAVRS